MKENKSAVYNVFIIHLIFAVIPLVLILVTYFSGSPLFSVLLIVSAVIVLAGVFFQYIVSRSMSK
ncbi:MAG TPA: hypothetical protein VIL89_01185, partial [Clostridia bacterium]